MEMTYVIDTFFAIFAMTFLLWIGWFGFNGGSVGAISSKENADVVALTIMNTNTTGLSGAIVGRCNCGVVTHLFPL